VAQQGEVPTLDGHTMGIAVDSVWLVYDRLTAYDPKLQPGPMLAESWEIGDGGRQIKLNLRKGVQFHSGRDFTSEDVKYNILRVRDPKVGAGSIAEQSKWFTAIDTPDKNTVVLKSDKPRPTVFDFFEYLNLLDKDTMEGPNAASKAVGTGPFVLAEWDQGVKLRFMRNKSYWQAGRPYLDEVVVNITPDAPAMLARLESGAVEIVDRAPVQDLVRLQKDGKYQALINQAAVYVINANTTIPPYDNKLVRQALNYGIDRKRFIATALQGLTEPRALIWSPSSPAFDAAKNAAYAFDLDKAKGLLAQAGVTIDDMELVWIGANADLRTLAEIYQNDLAKIGVKAILKPLEAAAWRDYTLNMRHRGLNLTSAVPVDLSPLKTIDLRNFSPAGGSSGYKSERYSALYEQLSVESDPARLKALYSDINDLLLDESFTMPICTNPTNMVSSAKVHGVRYAMYAGLNYTDAWLD
jgi:peptide/nickel transport system substrate-binding protein